MRVTPKGTLLSCNCFILHKICLHIVVYGCANFSQEILILGLQQRDKAAMLVVNTKEIFLLNLHQNIVHFPAERNAFVLDHQHGRRDVTCKPAIELITGNKNCVKYHLKTTQGCTEKQFRSPRRESHNINGISALKSTREQV